MFLEIGENTDGYMIQTGAFISFFFRMILVVLILGPIILAIIVLCITAGTAHDNSLNSWIMFIFLVVLVYFIVIALVVAIASFVLVVLFDIHAWRE